MGNNDRFVENFENVQWNINGQTFNSTENALTSAQKSYEQQAIQKYMPIGTVVKLKNVGESYMIIGFKSVDSLGENKDYMACLYPNGLGENNPFYCFNHEDIERIYHIGYFDMKGKKHQSDLNEQEFRR